MTIDDVIAWHAIQATDTKNAHWQKWHSDWVDLRINLSNDIVTPAGAGELTLVEYLHMSVAA